MRQSPDAMLHARLKEAAAAPQGAIFRADRGGYEIVVLKDGAEVQLFFAAPRADGLALSGVMSRIDVRQPLKLLGEYTQAMLLALLWAPAPKRIYAAGLGGGRVPLVLHHALPEAMIDATEIDPVVAEIAQRFFALAPDPRLAVHIEDGLEFLRARAAQYDIMLIDCYGGAAAVPEKFAAPDFYALCKSRLAPGGVLASNIDLDDPALAGKLDDFAAAFPHAMQFNTGHANVLFGAEAAFALDQRRLADMARLFANSAPIRALARQLKPLRR